MAEAVEALQPMNRAKSIAKLRGLIAIEEMPTRHRGVLVVL